MIEHIIWVAAANLVIWTGLFVYLVILDSKLRTLEKER